MMKRTSLFQIMAILFIAAFSTALAQLDSPSGVVASDFTFTVAADRLVLQAAPIQRLELQFGTHIQHGLPEQDAYIEKVPGSGQIFRATEADMESYGNAQLYATMGPNRHNPFDAAANGPYVKDRPLGITLAEWLAAAGTASYACADNRGTVTASFENLVPQGLYTVWYFFVPTPHLEPHQGAYDLPLGARDGSDNTFRADAEGNATLEVSFEPCLQLSGVQLAAGLGVAWHSNDLAYGASPGAFGYITHAQIFTMFPKEEEIETDTATLE